MDVTPEGKFSKRKPKDPCKRLMCEVEFWEVFKSKVLGFCDGPSPTCWLPVSSSRCLAPYLF